VNNTFLGMVSPSSRNVNHLRASKLMDGFFVEYVG